MKSGIVFCYVENDCLGVVRDFGAFPCLEGKPWMAYNNKDKSATYHDTKKDAKCALVQSLGAPESVRWVVSQ